MSASIFIGVIVDGFIARPNGDLDFLPPGGGEPHNYDGLMASVDALVIGRKIFETVLTFPAWPYGQKSVVALSSRPVDLSAVRGALWNRWPDLRLRSLQNLLRVVPTTSMLMEGSRFSSFCGRASFNASLSAECLCSLEREFLCSARYRAISGSVT
jgi:hypothetical protein